jgi:hypothetical protein
MMHLAQWNWGGIGFVGFMIAMIALSGWATERLRRWAERPEPKPKLKPLRVISFEPSFHEAELAALRAAAKEKA